MYAGLCRPNTVIRALQAQRYLQGCTYLSLYPGLYWPCVIHMALQFLKSTQGFVLFMHGTQGVPGPALYAELYRLSTICRALQGLYH